MIRRVASIILYLLGGWLLTMEAILAFAGEVEGSAWPLLFALPELAAFFLLLPIALLALGAWASPGVRLREVGLTLMIVAGFTAFIAAMLAYMMVMPDTRAFFDWDSEAAPNGYGFGGANLLVMAALGWLMYRRGSPSVGERDA